MQIKKCSNTQEELKQQGVVYFFFLETRSYE
jgi:hypothetical protein